MKRIRENMGENVEIGVQLIEWFKDLTGFDAATFLDYMNKNNVWDILNDASVVKGSMWAEEEDIINLLGRFLTKDEQHNIISRNNS